MADAAAPLVQVLLSTYNGCRFLRAQLDSLLAQDYPNLRILVRDDGSTDGTRQVLAEYEQYPQVDVIQGDNVGVVRSFFELMANADPAAAYAAFCDQDDVWLPGKVSQAVSCLQQAVPVATPGLYCSRYTVVDQNLKRLAEADVPVRGPSFANALVQNIAPGCSMVLNRPALTLLVGRAPGPMVPVHDWWCYLVVAALGKVIYDPASHLWYRQHGANTIGAETDFLRKWTQRVRRFAKQSGLRVVSQQAAEFHRLYGPALPARHAEILQGFLSGRGNLRQRIKYAMNSPVHRQNRLDDVIFRALVIANRV